MKQHPVVMEAPEAAAPAPATAPAQAASAPAAPATQPGETAGQKPKRFSDLAVRIGSGAIYIVIIIGSMLWGNIPAMVVLSVAAGICASELFAMLRKDAKLPNEFVGIAAAVLYPPTAYWLHLRGMAVFTMLLLLALLVWYVFYQRARITDVCLTFFGAVYAGMPLSTALLIRPSLPEHWGGVVIIIVFASVWLNDSFAYLVGCRFGKHRLAPKISPKKSWEGFHAGIAAGALTWLLLLLVPGVTITWWEALLCGLACGLMSVLGDLAESRMKRNSGVKDSGKLMPGHGGLLDRMDSLILATVSAAIMLVGFGFIPRIF